jgi:hypothetical protein
MPADGGPAQAHLTPLHEPFTDASNREFRDGPVRLGHVPSPTDGSSSIGRLVQSKRSAEPRDAEWHHGPEVVPAYTRSGWPAGRISEHVERRRLR